MAKLFLYEVPHRGHTATVKLSEADAELIYGDQAKRVADAYQGEPQSVSRPPYATNDSVADPGLRDRRDEAAEEKRAAAPRNKARPAAQR